MKNILRKNEGSAIVYTIVTLTVLVFALIAIYMSVSNQFIADLDVAEQIKTTYEKDVNNVDTIYQTLTNG